MASTISGTQSPPLEATGEDKPMGASSVDKVGEKVEYVKDAEQRKEYFKQDKDEASAHKERKTDRQRGAHLMGESLSDKFDERT